jgi:hypothetical protein
MGKRMEKARNTKGTNVFLSSCWSTIKKTTGKRKGKLEKKTKEKGEGDEHNRDKQQLEEHRKAKETTRKRKAKEERLPVGRRKKGNKGEMKGGRKHHGGKQCICANSKTVSATKKIIASSLPMLISNHLSITFQVLCWYSPYAP